MLKNYKALWGSISILIGTVIAILALARGTLQIGLLLGVFAVWGIWVVAFMLVPYIEQAKRRRIHQQQAKERQTQAIAAPAFSVPELDEPVDQILLRHVNYRISAYLRSAYPNVTWEWCEKSPASLVVHGGTGRIRVFNIPDFNFADVKLDQQGQIDCAMVKIVPLAETQSSNQEGTALPPNQQPVDPQVWYEVQGRQVLENLIADLHSRGHSSLMLLANGEVSIHQDDKDVLQDTFKTFPAKTYWPRLIQVLEQNGLAAVPNEVGIQVSW